MQHLSIPPQALRERLSTIPAPVEQVVLRALAKDPKARFTSVKDFAESLERASQRVLAPSAQQALEQPAPSQTAATSYETVAGRLAGRVTPSAATHQALPLSPQKADSQTPLEPLSPQEQRVLRLLVAGQTYAANAPTSTPVSRV